MAKFTFEPKMKKPADYEKSPTRAVVDEARQFTRARRAHGYRDLMGLNPEDPTENNEGDPRTPGAISASPDDCQACKEGVCEDPSHPREGDADALASLEISLKRKPKRPDDHDFDE